MRVYYISFMYSVQNLLIHDQSKIANYPEVFQLHVVKLQCLCLSVVCVHAHVLLLTLGEDGRVCDNYAWLHTWTIPKSYLISYFFFQETSHMERALHPEHTVFAPALIIISAD